MRTYVIFEQATGGRFYLASLNTHPDNSSLVPYTWGQRGNALRIQGKAQALRLAEQLETAIRARGYTPGRIVVQPATGGQAVTR